nr:probable tetraacyldisaccharide 4'-kinase, mitochondrial [Tanacetum cinerariifolium]
MWHDLDIVMVNTLSPWRNHHLIPFGPLREPLTAISHANAAIIHHTDMVPDWSLYVIESTILEKNWFLHVYWSAMTPSHSFKPPNVSSQVPLEVLCVSAIGSPDSFMHRIETVRSYHSRKMNVHPDVNFEGLARLNNDFNRA